MRSRAHFKSHPIHPILIPFPIAFLSGSFLFDISGIISGRPQYHEVAFYIEIAGILFALLAAIPGIIDFIYTVPPKSSGKKRAARHGIINVSMVIIFTIAWFYRQNPDANMYMVTGAEAIGTLMLVIAGWMGGTLAYRNQIGVDVRYAHAGKWNEGTFSGKEEVIEVASVDEIKLNAMKLLRIGDKRIALAKTDSGYVAFDDRCTHKGGALSGGAVICGTVQCPWHGSQFETHNGAVAAGPAKEKIHTYPVTERNGKLYINPHKPSLLSPIDMSTDPGRA